MAVIKKLTLRSEITETQE